MVLLINKMLRLKEALIVWNKQVFGNLDRNIIRSEEELLAAQQGSDEVYDSFSLLNEVNRCEQKLGALLRSKYSLLKQKSKCKWIQHQGISRII